MDQSAVDTPQPEHTLSHKDSHKNTEKKTRRR